MDSMLLACSSLLSHASLCIGVLPSASWGLCLVEETIQATSSGAKLSLSRSVSS